jgi:deazaflavin-dependent oxidoreductase (nitroreductase family)
MSDRHDFNRRIIEEFRANRGVVGGAFAGAPVVLRTTSGAKTGRHRVTPVVALPADSEVLYVFASKGGAPTNPDWYHNLLAHPEVEVEFGEERYPATARPVTGAERDRIFAEQAARFPAFAGYQRSTSRVIPVVELRRRS